MTRQDTDTDKDCIVKPPNTAQKQWSTIQAKSEAPLFIPPYDSTGRHFTPTIGYKQHQ